MDVDLSLCTPETWSKNEKQYLNYIKNQTSWDSIPLLNANDLQDLKDQTLVRFQGMVQDMYNPEYYYEQYEVVNIETYEKTMKIGKYLDAADCKDKEVINIESNESITSERHTLFGVSPPALNTWVENVEEIKYKLLSKEESSSKISEKSLKRNFAKSEAMETNTPNSNDTDPQNETNKKLCSIQNNKENVKTCAVSQEHILNFPLPDRKGKACHLKIYEDSESLKLNNLYEFVGFLSVNPLLSYCPNEDEDSDNDVEMQTHNPPPSLIPRLHCVAWRKLEHNNPLLTEIQSLPQERMQFIKKELQILFTQLLLGDTLAAEYLIFHLISEVYLRKDFMAIGKFSLNISNVPIIEEDYVKQIYNFIEMLVPKSYYFAMTLDNMNELAFTPKKDYTANRLKSGILQISSNTHVLLDETKLKPGQLNETGVKNMSSIAKAIKAQKVLCDFGFYELDFDCDIPFFIMSEGKSMLPSDFHVPLKPDENLMKTFKETIEAAKHFLKPDLLNEIRVFLTLARMAKYEISDDVHELIQNEFADIRKSNSSFSADDLHQLLVLARLACLSEGKNALDGEYWRKACNLEKERKARLIN